MQTKKFLIILAACLLVAVPLILAVVFGWIGEPRWNDRHILQITLEGEQELTVEYGQPYEDPGASAYLLGKNRDEDRTQVPVTLAATVDAQKLGTYLVKYVANHDGYVGTAYRRVHVVDTQAPVITLVSDPEKFTFPNETYAEEGFTATDNHDGDLTAAVQRSETREKVTYTVTDASGNSAVVERVIVYNDPVPPQISLSGPSTVLMNVGQTYKEPGYTAADNCDGDLTGKVSVTGNVDTTKPGSYTLTYSVTDAYQNLCSVTRTVNVREAKHKPAQQEIAPPNVVIPNGKVIYLTFDDGPGPRTPELLDILKKYNVKATFFVVNTKFINTIKRAAEEGHAIAVHSTTHKFDRIYRNEDAYFEDLYTMQQIIKNLTGQESKLLRFPGGSSNTTSRKYSRGIMTRLTRAVAANGFRYFDWNVDSMDAGGAKTADQVYYNVINGISNKQISVVLQHDIKGYSIDAVERIIQWGLANGYTFLPLDETSPICQHNVNN